MLPSQKRANILKTYRLNGLTELQMWFVNLKIMKIERVSKVSCLLVQ